MELFLSDKATDFSHVVHIVYEYLGLSHSVKITPLTEELSKHHNVPSNTSFLLLDSSVESNPVSILEHLTRKSRFLNVLWGKDETEKTQIHEFLKSQEKVNLAEINKLLLTRTYLFEGHITIADLWLYVKLLPQVIALKEKDLSQHCNVVRYVDFLQHVPALDEVLAARSLTYSLSVEPKWVNLNDPLLLQNVDINKKKQKREDKAKAKEEYFKKLEETKSAGNTGETASTANISINTNPNEKKEKKPQNNEKKPEQAAKAEENKGENVKPKEEKKEQPKKEPKQQQQAKKKEEDDVPAISKLDLRVGKVVKIWPNEESDKLYNEEIDIGNGEIRTIASGLKKRIPIEVLKDSYVIVLCNLKGRKLCNYFSHGMLLCASGPGEDGPIEPIRPPEGSQPGDQITVGSFPRKPVAELNPKKNPWDDVKDQLVVNENCVACFGEHEWTTPKGKIKTVSLKNVKIS